MTKHTIETYRQWLTEKVEAANEELQRRRRHHIDSVTVALLQEKLYTLQAALAELNGELF